MAGSLLVGCNRGSHPSATACCPDESARDAIALVDAGLGQAERSPEGARLRRDEGCARDFKTQGALAPDLLAIEHLCAQGMAPLLAEAVSAHVSAGGHFELPFRTTGTTACLRAGAVATSGGLTLSLVTDAGEVLSMGSSSEPVGLVPVDGTVCVREPGTYRVIVRPLATSDGATIALQVWQATRD